MTLPPAVRITRLKSPRGLRAAARLLAASDPWLRLGLDERRCLKTLTAPYRENYQAAIGVKFAGLVTVAMHGTFRGYIQVLFVADGCRGAGVGEKLLAAAERRIFKDSPNVFLCVSSFNKGAIRFYRRQGYEKAGLLKDFVRQGLDEILMRKTRGPLLRGKGKHG
ncbi:MAG: GNAT family N-acetyltransferase [Elusimicrobia bacterium]|nr:GNAT family N-acetyltransferase [Elusimicrobiota bacterium]